MEERFAKLGEYRLRELQKTYYFQWRELKRDLMFFTPPGQDQGAFDKITELKKKYLEIKEYLEKKDNKKVEGKSIKEILRDYYFF